MAWAGSEKGEVASRAAVEYLTAGFAKLPRRKALSALLTRLVQEANVHVYETGRRAQSGRNVHGDHAGRVRPPLRSRWRWRMPAIRAAT